MLLLGTRFCTGLTAASDGYTDLGPIDIIGAIADQLQFDANRPDESIDHVSMVFRVAYDCFAEFFQ